MLLLLILLVLFLLILLHIQSNNWPKMKLNVKCFCTLKCPIFYLFNIKIFLQFKFQICAYTQLKSKKIKNNNKFLKEGARLDRIWRKGYAKTNKDLGISFQVEYRVFLRWQLSFNHVKVIFKHI